MGSWDYVNYGISVADHNRELAMQLLECMGVDFENVCMFGETDCYYDNTVCIGAAANCEFEFETIFAIAKKLFGAVILYEIEDAGTTVTDWYDTRVTTLDSEYYTGSVYHKEYCDGDGTGLYGQELFDFVDWNEIKSDIESALKEENKRREAQGEDVIEVSWNVDEYDICGPCEDNSDFYDFCKDYVFQNVDLDGFTEEDDDFDISTIVIHGVDIELLIDTAKNKDYQDLVELLEYKFQDPIGEYDFTEEGDDFEELDIDDDIDDIEKLIETVDDMDYQKLVKLMEYKFQDSLSEYDFTEEGDGFEELDIDDIEW